MTTWANADLLIQLLERHRDFVLARQNEWRLFAAGRWLTMIESEPQIQGLVLELHEECKQSVAAMRREDTELRQEIVAQWEPAIAPIEALLAGHPKLDEAYHLGDCKKVTSWLNQTSTLGVSLVRRWSDREIVAQKAISAASHLLSTARSIALERAVDVPAAVAEMLPLMERYRWRADHLQRKECVRGEQDAYAALRRIQHRAQLVNPSPPVHGDADALAKVIQYQRDVEIANKAHSRDADFIREMEGDEISTAAVRVELDIRLVTHELCRRILAGRSRLALVRRFAARCEAFDRERLRQLCTESAGRVEQSLTLEFARYLFDQGLSPLLEVTVSGLRPDVIEVLGGSFSYVEAKQYDGGITRNWVKHAVRQVWSTWGRLRNVKDCPEAFLLIFRLGGARLELPECLRHQGRVLYPVMVDISPEGGSKEKTDPLGFSEAELLPEASTENGRAEA